MNPPPHPPHPPTLLLRDPLQKHLLIYMLGRYLLFSDWIFPCVSHFPIRTTRPTHLLNSTWRGFRSIRGSSSTHFFSLLSCLSPSVCSICICTGLGWELPVTLPLHWSIAHTRARCCHSKSPLVSARARTLQKSTGSNHAQSRISVRFLDKSAHWKYIWFEDSSPCLHFVYIASSQRPHNV
jgi:hypothetical protein